MGFDISSLFKRGSNALFGLDIGSSSVKMVELGQGGKSGYRIERYAIKPLPKGAMVDGNVIDFDAVVAAIEEAKKDLRSSSSSVAMALPTAAVIGKRIVMPAGLRDEELELQVESASAQYIPFAMDEVSLDFQVLGPSQSSPEEIDVYIAASKRERVDEYVGVADAAGLKVTVVTEDSLALLSAYDLAREAFPGNGEGEIILLAEIGATNTRINIMRDDVVVYNRDQDIGGEQLTNDIVSHYGMTFEEAEEAKCSGNLPDGYKTEVLEPYLENLGMEISRALQFFFTSTQYSRVDRIVLCGGGAVVPGIADAVALRTSVSTSIANPFLNMERLNPGRMRSLDVDMPALLTACGLALRRFDPS